MMSNTLSAIALCLTATGCLFSEPDPPAPLQTWNNCADGNCEQTSGYCGDRPPKPNGVMLPVPGYMQQCQQWCWAASAAMITGYYGNHITECQFASVLMFGNQYSCCNPNGCVYCNRTATMPQLSVMMNNAGIRHRIGGPLSENELQVELSNGRPIIIELRGLFSGHAVVVSGYQMSGGQAMYSVLDPWFGQSSPNYWQLRNGYNGGQSTWYGTMYRLSPRADGCNKAFDPSCGCDKSSQSDLPGGYDFSN